jgi:hypothetical protein
MEPQTDERQRMGDPRVPVLEARIAELEAALREDAGTFFKLGQTLKLAGMERAYVWHAKSRYELLGSVPEEVLSATSDDDSVRTVDGEGK